LIPIDRNSTICAAVVRNGVKNTLGSQRAMAAMFTPDRVGVLLARVPKSARSGPSRKVAPRPRLSFGHRHSGGWHAKKRIARPFVYRRFTRVSGSRWPVVLALNPAAVRTALHVQSCLLVAMKSRRCEHANLVTGNLKQRQLKFGNLGQASSQIDQYLSSAFEGTSWECRIS
jgi:hypothetical protein